MYLTNVLWPFSRTTWFTMTWLVSASSATIPPKRVRSAYPICSNSIWDTRKYSPLMLSYCSLQRTKSERSPIIRRVWQSTCTRTFGGSRKLLMKWILTWSDERQNTKRTITIRTGINQKRKRATTFSHQALTRDWLSLSNRWGRGTGRITWESCVSQRVWVAY